MPEGATAGAFGGAVLLATKLHAPRLRPELFTREKLMEQLAADPPRLTLVDAGAGWGKSTLLAQWRASDASRFGWLSLEPADNDPVRFWTYVVVALQTVSPGLGERFRDVDGRQRTRRLDARSERAAIREARAILAGRDGGERVVPARLTLDEFARNEWFPLLESLVAAGRRSERHTDDIRGRYRIHVRPRLGHMLIGDVEPRHIAALLRTMRGRRPRPYTEATIANILNVIRALYRLAQSRGYVSRSPVAGLDSAELPRPRPTGAGRVLDEG